MGYYNGRYYDYDDEKRMLIGACTIIAIIVAIILFFCFRSHDYAIDVKSVQWVWTVNIEELKVVHKTGETYAPSNAYNVRPYTDTVTKHHKDSNGHEWTTTELVTRYDYDINKWIKTREVMNAGTDKNPTFKEFTLKESTRSDNVGAEREANREKHYYAHGPQHRSDNTTWQHIEISADIWGSLRVGDELMYSKRNVGKPYDIRIAQ